jgi:enamine deaminase RidA (YjgF/YER057c/UK114 family)
MRRLLLPLVLLLALVASACGGSEPTAQQAPQDAVFLAASKTSDAGTYKADISGTVDAAGQSVELSGSGEFDGTEKRGTMSMTTTVAGQDIDMDVVYAYPDMYMRFPPGLLPGLPGGKPWVKIDLAELGKRAGFGSVALMQSQQQADPSQGLKYLEGLKDIEAVGAEDVRGVPTTHYKGVVDLNDLAEKNPELKPSVDKLMEQAGVSRIPMEAWIDDDGFVRQIKETFDASGATTSMTIQLYDFGTDVNVEKPPADEVVDFSELTGQS